MNLQIWDRPELLSAALADRLQAALQTGPESAVMLAGGSTPMDAYARLSRFPLDSHRFARVFLSDERCVAIDSPESNQGRIRPLLEAAGMPRDRFLSIPVGEGPVRAAEEFDRVLTQWVRAHVRIHLGLLGLGTDGHTASLFSATDVATGRTSGRFAIPIARPSGPWRISVTPQLLARVEELIFVVAGESKAEILARFVRNPESLPAGLATRGHSGVSVWADRAATSRLNLV